MIYENRSTFLFRPTLCFVFAYQLSQQTNRFPADTPATSGLGEMIPQMVARAAVRELNVICDCVAVPRHLDVALEPENMSFPVRTILI